MKIFVNNNPFDLLPGMTVKHALTAAGLHVEIGASKKPYDEWGNELGLGGALSEGMKIYVSKAPNPLPAGKAGRHQIPNKFCMTSSSAASDED